VTVCDVGWGTCKHRCYIKYTFVTPSNSNKSHSCNYTFVVSVPTKSHFVVMILREAHVYYV
jgi:hypothetical protein